MWPPVVLATYELARRLRNASDWKTVRDLGPALIIWMSVADHHVGVGVVRVKISMNQPATDTVIAIENLSKRYLVGHRTTNETVLRDVISREFRNFVLKTSDLIHGKEIVSGDEVEEFWALKDVSLEIKRGDLLGIIGRNGAGKSTLLKILGRITEPTNGRIRVRGNVASLLEVGTGFHPELTGRENIFLNAAILGMTRRETIRKFDEIVAFAEVEHFLDTPVKRFSSGMYVRLAFAVAAHLDPDILVVDEVLAVGDHVFQKKCLGKMKSVSSGGRTVLFVSHNMMAVRALCDRAIVLKDGRMVFDGGIQEAIKNYTGLDGAPVASDWSRPATQEIPEIGFLSLSASLIGQQPALKLRCTITLACRKTTALSFVAVDIRDQFLTGLMQAIPNAEPFIPGEPGTYHLQIEIALPQLIPGLYYLDFWIGRHYTKTADEIVSALSFEVMQSPTAGRTQPHTIEHGSMVPFSTILSMRKDESCLSAVQS
jgi:lipopolysaccharide transport system ATP-binding protein